ncbi:hypothetical protein [Methylobacterium sp. UNC378MF]|jgi:hypothetical protein|nr:hypothetical protein [Methylobacterium sp. UNC378MF]
MDSHSMAMFFHGIYKMHIVLPLIFDATLSEGLPLDGNQQRFEPNQN